MMDLAEIQRRAQAARESTIEIDGATFTMRLPTPLETRVACVQAGGVVQSEQVLRAERIMLCGAIVGWSGVPLSWVLHDAETGEFYEYSPEAVGLLLDQRAALAIVLGDQMSLRMHEWNERQGTAAKNSSTASSGKKPHSRRRNTKPTA